MSNNFFKKNVLFYLFFVLVIIIIITLIIFLSQSSKISDQAGKQNNNNFAKVGPVNQNIADSETDSEAEPNEMPLNSTGSSAPFEIFMPATTSLNISPTRLANPASINCEKVGGKLHMKKDGAGGEYGLCYFDDNRACEEWALLKGDCPWGGRRTTGFDTEAQRYCVWRGGETYAVEKGVCKFKDGSSCLDDEFYNETCSPGQNK